MEERSDWRGALGTAWGNLTGIDDDGNVRVYRWLFFFIFLAGTAWAVWNYMQSIQLMELERAMPSPAPNVAEADRIRLDGMIQSVQGTSNIRQNSMEAVVRMEQDYLVRYPFDEPRLEEDVIPPDELLTGAIVPEVVIDYPPEGITLRGIMIMGRENVAVMDIPGVGTGMIVRAGDTFMQRKGRVVRIAPDKVIINWGGKNWDIAPSF